MKKVFNIIKETSRKYIRIVGNYVHACIQTLYNLAKGLSSSNKRNAPFRRWMIAIISIYCIAITVLGYIVYTGKPYILKVKDVLSFFPLPAAYVNGNFVMTRPILLQVAFTQKFSQQSGQQVDGTQTLLQQFVSTQIDDVLVAQKLNSIGESISRKDIDSAFKKVTDENGGEKEVEKILTSLYGMSIQQFKTLIATQIKKDKLIEKGIQKAKVKHILFSDETQAKAIIKDIQDGKKSFEDEAKENSKDANTRDKGGDLGEISRGSMPQNFDDVAFDKAELDKVYGDPIKTDFGFHIIKVESRSGTINQSYDQWLESARKNAKIITFLK